MTVQKSLLENVPDAFAAVRIEFDRIASIVDGHDSWKCEVHSAWSLRVHATIRSVAVENH